MQTALPEFVTDALTLRGDRVDAAVAHLLEAVGLDPQTALKLALGIIVELRREITTLTEDLASLQGDYERLVGRAKLWLEAHPVIDPEAAARLEDILETEF